MSEFRWAQITECRKCVHVGWVMPTPDALSNEPWINGKTLWCSACGHAWNGTDAEIVAAIAEQLFFLPAPKAPHDRAV